MYRILIIEDEPLERAALCKAVERLYPEAQVREARDGQDALEKIEEEPPEVAMVDLNIPGISGLELIQILKEREYAGKIVILTAYDTSSYIRQALGLGVLEYLLKPASMSEIRAALEKCFAALSKDQQMAKREEMHLLSKSYTQGKIWGDILSGLAPRELLAQAFGWPEDGNLKVWFVKAEGAGARAIEAADSLEEENGLPLQVLKDEREGTLRLLLRGEGVPSDTGLLLECLLSFLGIEEGKAAVYGPLSTYEELKGAVTREEGSAYRYAYHKLGDREAISKLSAKWEGKLREGSAKSFVRMWKRRIAGGEEELLPESFLLHASLLVHVLWTAYQEEADYRRLGLILLGSKPYGELEEYLQSLLEASQGKENGQEDAGYLLQWMEEHYMEDLTRADAARAVGLSESYFSVWFGQRTGTTFVGALQGIRIRHARERLEKGERDLKAIAADCGFYRYKTFGEVFKKVEGRSVTEYIALLDDGGHGVSDDGGHGLSEDGPAVSSGEAKA